MSVLLSCRESKLSSSVPQIYYKALYSKVLTFDPSRMTDTASLSVANQIYDGLLEFGPHFDIQPALAETWETSADGKTLTFKLRKNVRFHDGSPLSAEDCVASFRRLLSPTSLVAKHYDLIESVDASGPHTFVIRLKNKFPPFAAVLAGEQQKFFQKIVLKKLSFLRPWALDPLSLYPIQKAKLYWGAFIHYEPVLQRTSSLRTSLQSRS